MKLFSFLPIHDPSVKILPRLFLRRHTEINGHLLSRCFKNAVLGVKKWWNAMFFLTPNRNLFAGKFLVNLERLLAVLQGHIIFNVKWDEVHKMSEVFWAKLYCKMSIFFGSFCLLWDFLLKNLKLKKLWWCPLERVDEYKKVVCPKKYFQKSNFKYEILNNLYFGPNFFRGLL